MPGAEETAPAMARLVAAAREAGIVHVASADDHELTDPEISDEPDFTNTYPPHCLRGTPGAERVPETKQADPLPLSLVPFPPGLVPGLIEGRRELLFLKKNFDVFTNPNTAAVLDVLDPDEIVVFGVATDVCDDAAIRGFLLRGRRVRFVEDADHRVHWLCHSIQFLQAGDDGGQRLRSGRSAAKSQPIACAWAASSYSSLLARGDFRSQQTIAGSSGLFHRRTKAATR